MMYRIVQCKFWQDSEVFKWEAERKLLFLYLITSDKTNQLGILEATKEQIAHDTGIGIQKVEKILKELEQIQKIFVDHETNEIFVRNFGKYNWTKSPKMIKHLEKLIENIKSKKIKYHVCFELKKRGLDIDVCNDLEDLENINSNYSGYSEQNNSEQSEVKEEKKQVPYQEIVDLYHQICTSLPKVVLLNEKRKQLLRARWKEHPDLEFWKELFQRVENSDFLTGRKADFRADFEWIIRPTNFVKIIEGRYDNVKQNTVSVDDEIINRLKNKLL